MADDVPELLLLVNDLDSLSLPTLLTVGHWREGGPGLVDGSLGVRRCARHQRVERGRRMLERILRGGDVEVHGQVRADGGEPGGR